MTAKKRGNGNRGLILAALAILLLFGSFSPAYGESKVGFINVQRIVSQSELGKKASVMLGNLKQEKTGEVEKKRMIVQGVAAQVQEERGKKNPDGKRIRDLMEEGELQKKQLKRLVEDVNEELSQKEGELVAVILKKAAPLLEKIAKDRGYTVILKSAGDLAYLDPKADITDILIGEMDKEGGGLPGEGK